MFPVGSRSRNRGRGFAFNRGAKIPPSFDARLLSDTYNPLITHSRASVRTYFDSTGTLQTAAIDTWPVEYDPSTLRRIGRNISEARTNSIRNNTMAGASAGTPGTAPTNWAITTTNAELVSSIVGTGTEDGITYIDVRIAGTVTASRDLDVRFEAINQIAAVAGQAWTESIYLREVGGSQTNISAIYLQANTYTSGSVYVNTPWFTAKTVTTAALRTQRPEVTGTLSGGTVAYIVSYLKVTTASSGAVDFTIRIGMPQLELGLGATPVIATSSAAVARSPDLLSITGTNFSGFWNPTQGTFVARYMLVDASNGSNQFVARASDNSYNNSIAMNTNATGFPAIATASGGVFDGVATAAAALTDSVFSTVAVSYSAAGISISKDGAAVVTDSSLTFPTGMTRLDIGGDHAGANHFGSGWLQSLVYYSQAMPTLLRSLSA